MPEHAGICQDMFNMTEQLYLRYEFSLNTFWSNFISHFHIIIYHIQTIQFLPLTLRFQYITSYIYP
jgi:hypothetical protein